MPDMEKVINAINICIGHGKCTDCSYHSGVNYSDQNCVGRMLRDTLAMLKEHEAVKPTWSRGKPYCGSCGLQIRSGGKFCSECGKQIAWEGRLEVKYEKDTNTL